MVHHATSARNEVGRAFLPVLPPAALQSFEQRSKDFPFLIFHNFSFLICHRWHSTRRDQMTMRDTSRASFGKRTCPPRAAEHKCPI